MGREGKGAPVGKERSCSGKGRKRSCSGKGDAEAAALAKEQQKLQWERSSSCRNCSGASRSSSSSCLAVCAPWVTHRWQQCLCTLSYTQVTAVFGQQKGRAGGNLHLQGTSQNTPAASWASLQRCAAPPAGGHPFQQTQTRFAAFRDAGRAPKGLGIAWIVCSAKAWTRTDWHALSSLEPSDFTHRLRLIPENAGQVGDPVGSEITAVLQPGNSQPWMGTRVEHFWETGTAQSKALEPHLVQTWPSCAPWGPRGFNEAKMIKMSRPLVSLVLK